jgi:hypothetical protein
MDDSVRIVGDAEGKYIVVNGKKYFSSRGYYRKKTGHQMVFEPIDEAKRAKVIDKISKEFAKKLTLERVLKEVLEGIEYKQLLRLEALLKKKVKPTVRKGCVEIQLGREFVTIV